jgi:predicted membrane protein
MGLEMLILFVFCFFILKVMSQNIRNESARKTFHIVITRTVFLGCIMFIFVLQIFRVFFMSFALKMNILFIKIWKKKDFDDLNESTIKKDADKYKDIENSHIEEGWMSFVQINF